jgi:hypothetical protein
MVKKTIIICSVILAVAILGVGAFFLFNKRVSDSEARDIVRDLLVDCYEINDIYYGKGLEFDALATPEKDDYAPVKIDCKYQNRAELEYATYAIFTKEYGKSIIDSGFLGSASYGVAEPPRFADRGGANGALYIRKDVSPVIEDIAQYKYDTIKVIKNSRRFIVAEVETREGDVVRITVRYEGKHYDKNTDKYGAWRLDSATY